MDLFSKKEIKKLLQRYQIEPLKRLGQNFLIDKRILKKIIDTTDIQPDDIILEIGPGIGNLTKELASRARKVIAVEKDKKMVDILKENLKDYENLKIVQKDILKINFKSIFNFKFLKKYKVVANLPYYITSPVIRKFLENENPPEIMILMVQKEVAQRIRALPPKMNLLAVSVQFYAIPKIISYVSKNSFWPRPKVDSAIIKIIPFKKLKKGAFQKFDKKFTQAHSYSTNQKQIKSFFIMFFKIVKAGFSQPRKQLINNLSRELKISKKETENLLLKTNIKPNQRAESLSVDNWIELTKLFML